VLRQIAEERLLKTHKAEMVALLKQQDVGALRMCAEG
jgi:hypothetical protein